jgi:hypothetical protein
MKRSRFRPTLRGHAVLAPPRLTSAGGVPTLTARPES